MKKSYFLICIISFFLSACSDKNGIPKGILPREKMELVMWDMLQAGEFLNDFVFNRDTSVNKVAESLKWYDKVYQIHGITKDQFVESYRYYKDHSDLMRRILDSLGKKDMTNDDPAIPENSISPSPEIDSAKLLMIDSIKKLRNLNRIKAQ